MKLLTNYNRVNIVTALFVLLLCSFCYYIIIRQILIKQIDRDLMVEEQEITDFIKENKMLPNASSYKGQVIQFKKIESNSFGRKIESAEVFDSAENELVAIRRLSFSIRVNGQGYVATVMKSQAETEDLLQLIFLVTAGIFVLLLSIIALLNRLLLRKLWQPFYSTLLQLRTYDLNSSSSLHLPGSKVDEFNELNTSVNEMTARVSQEFVTLKSFTDNASHEMQTPLAIIQSKLDLIIQSAAENQVEPLQAIYDATARMSKLNQTLLLLTKIDNQLYNSSQKVDMKMLVEKKCHQLEELIFARKLHLCQRLGQLEVTINSELAEILINNLLNNAIKHNIDGGAVNIETSAQKLVISNSGLPLTFDAAKIFERFQKGTISDGSGLGLAVVKQICNNSRVHISYEYVNDQHTISLYFQP